MKTNDSRPPPPTAGDGYLEKRKPSAAARGVTLPNWGALGHGDFFVLSASPTSFELVRLAIGWRLLPVLQPLIMRAGVNGTPQAEEGQALDRAALETRARSKWKQAVLANDGEIDEYLREVEGAKGPGYFLEWDQLRLYEDGTFDHTFDHTGYDAWRWSLVERGRIAPPREAVVAAHRRRYKAWIARGEGRYANPETAREKKKEATDRLAGLVEAVKANEEIGRPKSGKTSKEAA